MDRLHHRLRGCVLAWILARLSGPIYVSFFSRIQSRQVIQPIRLRHSDTSSCHAAEHMAAVLWFRKGLRLHDNPALLAAAATAARTNSALYPVLTQRRSAALPLCTALYPLYTRFTFILQ